MSEVISLARDAFRCVDGLKAGGKYILAHWTSDDQEASVVAVHQGPFAESLPLIQEPSSTFNEVTFSLYADTSKGTIVEVLVEIRSRPQGVFLGLVFMSNILGSLGGNWIVNVLDTLISELRIESAILCDRSDEGDVGRRVISGEGLTSIVLARATGRDPLPAPLLALIRADRCDEDTRKQARDRGLVVRLSLKKNTVLGSVDF